VTTVRTNGKIGTNGPETGSGSSSAAGYYGNGMKKVSRPRSVRSAYLSRRQTRLAGALIVLVAAIVVVSAVAMVPAKSDDVLQVDGPSQTTDRQGPPPPPFLLQGLTVDSVGGMVFDCDITILNVNTSAVNYTVSYDFEGSGYAYYEFDLNNMLGGIANGNVINITATHTTLGLIGYAEQAVVISQGYMMQDIVMNPGVIPEFPMVIIPVAGMIALVVVVSVKRRDE
jgi:hypothetical protein